MKVTYRDLENKLHEVQLPKYFIEFSVTTKNGQSFLIDEREHHTGIEIRSPSTAIAIKPRASNSVIICESKD